ncbi:MAG: hypothetical protein OXR66_02965 [Candidatus Woesearchaeota archaeon]|nr:hypothetical protein [Candidatus Woesearchaeota archaeon]
MTEYLVLLDPDGSPDTALGALRSLRTRLPLRNLMVTCAQLSKNTDQIQFREEPAFNTSRFRVGFPFYRINEDIAETLANKGFACYPLETHDGTLYINFAEPLKTPK